MKEKLAEAPQEYIDACSKEGVIDESGGGNRLTFCGVYSGHWSQPHWSQRDVEHPHPQMLRLLLGLNWGVFMHGSRYGEGVGRGCG